jgi:hypothetical protein
MVVVVLARLTLPLCEFLLQFEVCSKGLGLDLVEAGQEVLADVLVIVVQGLQHQYTRNHQKHVGVAAFQ